MSDSSQLNNLGEQIKGALNDALSTGDFKELNTLVSDTVKTAISDAEAASRAWKEGQKEIRQRTRGAGQTYTEYCKQQMEMRTQTARKTGQRAKQQVQLTEAQIYYQRTGLLAKVENVGQVSGVLFIVFGAIASVPLFVLSLIFLSFKPTVGCVFVLFLLAAVFAICFGKSKLQLISRAKRYVKLCGDKMYAEVTDLATQVGISPKKVVRELRKILQKGILPTAHLDAKGTHLMLNDAIYKQYLDAEKSRLLLEQQEKSKNQALNTAPDESASKPKTELEQMISEGQYYIKKLREMNDLIPGEIISNKLYRLEALLKEIFARVQKEPGQMNRMHKVMTYYLPTTLKLVEAYHEFDKVSNQGEEIVSAKKEIESTLDSINEAFVELLNNLFQDKIFDVTTDAQVLQTMLASEGLTKEMDAAK